MNWTRAKPVALTTLFWGFWGPLAGGLPYVWMVFTIPFVYVGGGPPALVAGLLYALWQQRGQQEAASGWRRAGRGALCGLVGCAVFGPMVAGGHSDALWITAALALHGVPAGAILGAWCRGPNDWEAPVSAPAAASLQG